MSNGRKRWGALAAMLALLLLALPAMAGEETGGDSFWEDEEGFFDDDEFFEACGSGGGPSITWMQFDFDAANEALEGEDLLAIPDQTLYWGGAGWGGIRTGDRLFVGIGGGGFSGSDEARQGDMLTRWEHGAGYFALKGIYAMNTRLFVEGGVALGGGTSHIWAEDQEDNGDITVKVRGDRTFVLLRPHVGLDIRLARWVGILVEGGYLLTSGEWHLDGNTDLISDLDMGEQSVPYGSVMIRFGI